MPHLHTPGEPTWGGAAGAAETSWPQDRQGEPKAEKQAGPGGGG